jgi:hypothetical protein
MTCELIALGCLAVHGDISETRGKKLSKAYEPDQILEALEGLHPEFYPTLCAVETLGNGVTKIKVNQRVTDYLTKADLIALWAECGGVLHRGTMRRRRTGADDDLQKIERHS